MLVVTRRHVVLPGAGSPSIRGNLSFRIQTGRFGLASVGFLVVMLLFPSGRVVSRVTRWEASSSEEPQGNAGVESADDCGTGGSPIFNEGSEDISC